MFQSRLYVRDHPSPDLWVQTRDLAWLDPVFGLVVAKAGATTNLASIPHALQGIPGLDPMGCSRRAAAAHDYLYGYAEGRAHGKDFADLFLRAAMLADGCSEAMADAYYIAVRDFGHSAWSEYTRDPPLESI